MNDFEGITPANDSLVNYPLAALIAYIEVGKSLIFSVERMSQYIDELSLNWKEQNPSVYSASLDYAMLVVGEIKSWYDETTTKETRTFSQIFRGLR